ncbi:hypothetical protein ACWDE9_28905 [Streptomyces olivaceoviridis]
MEAHADWLDAGRLSAVDGVVPGRENSALTPWPGVRRRSPARAAVRLRTPDGLRHAVAGWVPPGIFGDEARAAAAAVRSPVPPATLAVAPALVVSEDLTPAAPLGQKPAPHRLEEAVDYVLARARQLPVERAAPGGPMPAVLRTVTRALTGTQDAAAAARLHHLLSALAPSLPDHRCEAEKWCVDAAGRLRKTGHLAHAHRRDNELLTPLLDLAALAVAFGSGLEAVAYSISRRLPGRSWYAVLAVALLCYGTTRSEQLPRTYNPQRAAETAVEAYRLQRGMSKAAELVQHLLSDTVADPQWTAPRVVHRWQEPPGTLMQPRLPFGGIAARPSGPAPTGEETQMALKAVERWAEGPIQLVRDRANRAKPQRRGLADSRPPQRPNVGVSANLSRAAGPCAARVDALRTLGKPLNHRAHNASERNRCSKSCGVVEHGDATATSTRGEHIDASRTRRRQDPRGPDLS